MKWCKQWILILYGPSSVLILPNFHKQERKEREAQAAEGGWTVVTHHKGRKKTTDAESGITVSSVAQAVAEHNMSKKKSKEVGLDFYRFQRKEARRNGMFNLLYFHFLSFFFSRIYIFILGCMASRVKLDAKAKCWQRVFMEVFNSWFHSWLSSTPNFELPTFPKNEIGVKRSYFLILTTCHRVWLFTSSEPLSHELFYSYGICVVVS